MPDRGLLLVSTHTKRDDGCSAFTISVNRLGRLRIQDGCMGYMVMSAETNHRKKKGQYDEMI